MRPANEGTFIPMIQGVLVAILVSGLAVMLHGQQKPVIKNVTPVATSPSSGPEMFNAYCAVCHGVDGKGDGPAVPALKKGPGDLTLLARNAGGKFPELRVFDVIRGQVGVMAHGSKDMPVWGEVFRGMSGSDQPQTHLRLRNLTKHIESIQW